MNDDDWLVVAGDDDCGSLTNKEVTTYLQYYDTTCLELAWNAVQKERERVPNPWGLLVKKKSQG